MDDNNHPYSWRVVRNGYTNWPWSIISDLRGGYHVSYSVETDAQDVAKDLNRIERWWEKFGEVENA